MIHFYRSIVLFSILFPLFVQAVDGYDFIPRHAEQIIQINLTEIPGLESLRKDLIGTVSRQSGFDGKSDNSVDISKDIDKILVVTPNLTEDETFIFIQLKVPGNEFCKHLEQVTGLRHVSVNLPGRVERRFVLPESQAFFGIPSKKRTIAYAFPGANVAVFGKDSLDRYFNLKNRGLLPADRKVLQIPRALASGFTKISPQLLQDYPLMPPFYRADYSLSAASADGIRLQGTFFCADADSAVLVQQQFQQYITFGGLILNQYDPELMREWVRQIKVQCNQAAVTVKGDLSRAFLDRLTAASERMSGKDAGKGAGQAAAPAGKTQGNK